MARRTPCLLCASLLSPLFVASALAGSLNVSWNPSPNATGYRLHYGTSPGQYTSSLDVGPATGTAVSGLTDCVTYHFATVAYNAVGESGFSVPIASWPRPVVGAVSPSAAAPGQTLSVVLSGTNFQSGSTVTFADPEIAVTSVRIDSCGQITVDLQIGTSPGPRVVPISVIQPDGLAGGAAGLFSVLGATDTTAPQISGVAASSVGGTEATISWSTDEPATSQVLYRRSVDSVYQATSLDAALATSHSVTLSGLYPETSYVYHVVSADAAGNSAASTPDGSLTTTASPSHYVVFEAESGTLSSPFRERAAADAFAGAMIDTPAGSGSGSPTTPLGTAQYGFYLPASGTWRLWLRLHGSDPQSDSVFESVDGGSRQVVAAGGGAAWRWVAGRSYPLTSGLHALELGGAERGAGVDRILITDDLAFVPLDSPGGDVTPPGSVTSFAATPSGGTLTLTWTNPATSDFARTVIRYRSDGQHPVSPADGFPVTEQAGTAGSSASFVHTGLTSGTPYAYSAFALDAAGNAADPATALALPPGPPPPPDGLTVD